MFNSMATRARQMVRSLATISLVSVMATAMVLANPATATSAETDFDNITSLKFAKNTVGSFDYLRVDITWALSDETQPGYTWSLNLPEELQVVPGSTFTLKDSKGVVFANAITDRDKVTFTATDAVNDYVNVHGTAFFMVARASETVTNQPIPVTFTVSNGDEFTNTVTFTGNPGENTTLETYKWGKLDNATTLHWGLVGARPTQAGQVYTFTDDSGPGYEISCVPASITLWGLPFGLNNGAAQWIADNNQQMNGFKVVECTPNRLVATYTVQAHHRWDSFWQPHVHLTRVKVTDNTVEKWTNNGTVRIDSKAIPVSSEISNPQYGGDAEGETPVPTPTPTEPTTTDDPTTPAPTDPPTTPVPTPEPTTPAPTTPAPTTSVPPVVPTPVPTTDPTPPVVTPPVTPVPEVTEKPTVPPVVPTPAPTNPEDTTGSGNFNNGDNPKPTPVKPVVKKPVVKMVTRHFQVDTYIPRTKSQARVVANLAKDGKLHYREDRDLWGASNWKFVSVRVPANANKTQVMKAVSSKAGRQFASLSTTAKLKNIKPGQKVTIAWELGKGAKPVLGKAWGPKNKTVQVYLGRSK